MLEYKANFYTRYLSQDVDLNHGRIAKIDNLDHLTEVQVGVTVSSII